MARAAERDAKPRRDVAQGELLEARQLERRALPGRQLRQGGAQHPSPLFRRQLRPVALSRPCVVVQRLRDVAGTAQQRESAAQAAVVGVLQEPHPDGSARRIVEVRLAVDLEEDFLCDVLRFAGVAEDIQGDAVDEAAVSMEQRLHRNVVRCAHRDDEIGVRLDAAVAIAAALGPAAALSEW
jgi:hypothetical protein